MEGWFRMKPLIIIFSQSLACGCLIVDAMMRSRAERDAPHLILGEPVPSPDEILMELKLKWQEPVSIDCRLLRETAYERANPNQPWYAKFEKRRRVR
jgi:hypothetical protein